MTGNRRFEGGRGVTARGLVPIAGAGLVGAITLATQDSDVSQAIVDGVKDVVSAPGLFRMLGYGATFTMSALNSKYTALTAGLAAAVNWGSYMVEGGPIMDDPATPIDESQRHGGSITDSYAVGKAIETTGLSALALGGGWGTRWVSDKVASGGSST